MSTQQDGTIIVHSAVYQTEYTTKYRNRQKWQLPDPNEIKSHIPGTIISIAVKPGEAVKKGKAILILEAMKMHNQIQMPFDGTISEIKVNEGDRIPKNTVMVVVHPD